MKDETSLKQEIYQRKTNIDIISLKRNFNKIYIAHILMIGYTRKKIPEVK